MTESRIHCEQPDGIPWLVAHNPATLRIGAMPALPEWASPEFAEAVTGALRASVDGYCVHCEAVRRVPQGMDHNPPPFPHAAWCPWSDETITRLEAACRPPGTRWVADNRPETMARLQEHLNLLAAKLEANAKGAA